ncbi:MAG: alanine--tRNA ligase-related protein, partial [Candidatus Aenigmatarchaeota archaeon]
MLSTKELKKKYEKEFQKKPRESYPVKAIESLGFTRCKCEKCGRYFWSKDDRKVCGDAKCIGGYDFIGKTPAKNSYSYIELWDKFSKILGSAGYEEIDRYPVVARWRDDIEFVEASIDDFIPYVVNGVSPPPKNPLIVPQPCLRFNDIENVGVTGSHNTSFIMIGQHRFEKSEDYDFNQYLLDLFKWFNE